MQFAHPQYFYLFIVVVVITIFLFWRRRVKRQRRKAFADKKFFDVLIPGFDKSREIQKIVFIFFVGVFSVLALLRPQWGFEWREIKREGLDILVALDVSKSMLTQDVRPNRLERSKLAVRDLIKKLQGDRIGLIAFAGEGFLACPLTVDYDGFMMTLDDIDERTIPRGGTAIEEAMDEALRSYQDVAGKYKALVIITDGDNLQGDPLAMAKKAKEQGVKIFCVGMGTKEGELIRIINERGEQEFIKDASGNFVKSRLNENLLEQIALLTDGAYVRASGAQFGLDVIYDQRLSRMERRDIKVRKEKRFFERFQLPLLIGFILLLIESTITNKLEKKKK